MLNRYEFNNTILILIIFILIFFNFLNSNLKLEKPDEDWSYFNIDKFHIEKRTVVEISNPHHELYLNIISSNNQARQKLQNENEKLEAELLSEERILSEQRKILSVDEFRPKALEFDEKVSIIRTEQGEKEKFLKNKARKEESEFYKRIYPLLYELLLDRGGLVLIDQRNVILWDSSVDITDEAIKLINQVLGEDNKAN